MRTAEGRTCASLLAHDWTYAKKGARNIVFVSFPFPHPLSVLCSLVPFDPKIRIQALINPNERRRGLNQRSQDLTRGRSSSSCSGKSTTKTIKARNVTCDQQREGRKGIIVFSFFFPSNPALHPHSASANMKTYKRSYHPLKNAGMNGRNDNKASYIMMLNQIRTMLLHSVSHHIVPITVYQYMDD